MDSWFTPWRFVGLLTALLFLFHPWVFLSTETFFYRDYGVLGYPFIQYHHESFWRGEIPFWNPLSNCGTPFLAQWGTMTLYPFAAFYLIFPLPWSLGIFCFLHLILAGLGMYFLARRWTGNNFAASVAGMAFVANGLTLSSLLWPNYTVALGWMPWVVLLTERAWREGRRTILLAVTVGALQMLSGVPEITLLTWFLLGCMLLGQLGARQVKPMTSLMRCAAIIICVAGLCAVQLLPFFELLQHSQRDAGFGTQKWAMPAWGWANLVVPLFHYFTTPEGTMFQMGQAFVASYYPGLGALALAGLAVIFVPRKLVRLLAALTLFSLVLSLGNHGFLYTWVRQLIPVLGLGRYPIKFAYLAMFTLPLLAAFAIQRLDQLKAEQRAAESTRLLYVGLGFAVVIAALLTVAKAQPMPYDRWEVTLWNSVWRGVFLGATLWLLSGPVWSLRAQVSWLAGAGVVLLLGLDVLTHMPKQNPMGPANLLTAGAVREYLGLKPAPKAGESRVMISRAGEEMLLELGDADITKPFMIRRLGQWSNLNLLDAMPKVNGSSTLQIREQSEVQNLLYQTNQTELPHLLDFLAVSHEAFPGSPIQWTNRPSWQPLITFGAKPVFAEASETLKGLADPGFAPQEFVYLPVEARTQIAATNHADGKIIAQHFTANRVEVETENKAAGLLVIAQSYYPAWHAYIDGQPTALWRANHAFQALEIPSGHHQIVLKYEDQAFRLGVILSACTLAGLIVAGRKMK